MPVYDLLLSASIDKTDYVTPLFPTPISVFLKLLVYHINGNVVFQKDLSISCLKKYKHTKR